MKKKLIFFYDKNKLNPNKKQHKELYNNELTNKQTENKHRISKAILTCYY